MYWAVWPALGPVNSATVGVWVLIPSEQQEGQLAGIGRVRIAGDGYPAPDLRADHAARPGPVGGRGLAGRHRGSAGHSRRADRPSLAARLLHFRFFQYSICRKRSCAASFVR